MMAVAEPMAEPPAAPKPMRKAEWNPKGLTVPSLKKRYWVLVCLSDILVTICN